MLFILLFFERTRRKSNKWIVVVQYITLPYLFTQLTFFFQFFFFNFATYIDDIIKRRNNYVLITLFLFDNLTYFLNAKSSFVIRPKICLVFFWEHIHRKYDIYVCICTSGIHARIVNSTQKCVYSRNRTIYGLREYKNVFVHVHLHKWLPVALLVSYTVYAAHP